MLKKILISLIIIIAITTFIDYHEINNDKKPIFAIRLTKLKDKEEIFIGPIYKLKRTVNTNFDELLKDSKKVKYSILFFNILNKENITVAPFKIEYKESNINKLYLEDKDFYYSYNLENISIKENNKSYSLKNYVDSFSKSKLFDNALSQEYLDSYNYTIFKYDNVNIIKCIVI